MVMLHRVFPFTGLDYSVDRNTGLTFSFYVLTDDQLVDASHYAITISYPMYSLTGLDY